MTNFTRWKWFLSAGFILAALSAAATSADRSRTTDAEEAALERDLNEFLRRWDQNPQVVMNEPPARWDEDGRPLQPGAPGERRFSVAAIESGAALAERDRIRAQTCMESQGKKKCLSDQIGARAGMSGSDSPEELVDDGAHLIRTLEQLEARNLRRAWLPMDPWSGHYWPFFKGVTGARYWDAGFPESDWYSNFQYIVNNPAEWFYKNGSTGDLGLLAPSEKYDLLAGDSDFGFTDTQWAIGENIYRQNGYVEGWMGICHGWAAASLMVPRPTSTVRLPIGDRMIDFFPTDIKALASALWADGEYETRFAGGRCNVANPRMDGNGRIISEECFDTNPATWHLSVVNQLGVSRRGLILDSTYDYEIWNQPVVGYSYSYFNPQGMYHVGSLADARVPMSRFSNDRFQSYRSRDAVAVVGIVMDVSYMIETPPTHNRTDSSDNDYYRTVRYMYDLEIDGAGRVIGGEWYQNQHPDFLWVPVPGSRAVSEYEDLATGDWQPGRPLPKSWKAAALEGSGSGVPLARIVEALVGFSRRD